MTHPHSWTVAALCALGVLTFATPTLATTIHVSPGPGTPVQDAIDAASPGDTIRLAGGGYPEAITINKALRIYGPSGTYLDAKPQPAVIAAGCDPGVTGITVAADDVKIRDLRVVTFTEYGIAIQGRDKVTVKNVMTTPNCVASPLASIHVAASTRIKVQGVWAIAITDITGAPAIHLDGLAARANVRLRGTVAGDHEIGILVDGCAPGSVLVSGSYANFNNDTGIKLQNSDGIVVRGNQVAVNGASGIVVDAGSDDNFLLRNDLRQNVTDVSDAGTGNCWKNNSYTTGSVPECP